MRTYYIPALIMLSAGAVDCALAIRNHLSLGEMLRELLIVLIVFYFVGGVVKFIIDRAIPPIEEEEENGEEQAEEGEEGEGEESAASDAFSAETEE